MLNRLVVSAALVIAACGCATSHPNESNAAVEQVDVRGPLILAFLPPAAEPEQGDGAAEAMAHVEFALADTKKCMGDRSVKLKVSHATELLLVQGGRRTTVRIPIDVEHSIGAYLFDRDREPCVVYATGGPSSLQVSLPAAAGEFFGVPSCQDPSAGKLCASHDG